MSHDDLTTRPVRWGILGAGGIASSLAADITRTDGHVVAAVAARDGERAAEFARRYDAPRSYGSYDDLVADDDVDVVYVATTHPFPPGARPRRGRRRQAGAGGEAPTLTAAGAREVFDAAAQAGVFAMEAMWMRTNPLVRQALDLVAGGAIGEVRAVQADFAFALDYDRLPAVRPGQRRRCPAGPRDLPRDVRVALPGPPGPDAGQRRPGADRRGPHRGDAVVLGARGLGAAVQLLGRLDTLPGDDLGTGGWISLEPPFFTPTTMLVGTGGDVRRVEIEPAGYVPQVEEVGRCLRAGLLESPLVPQAETVAILELLDDVRAELGVSYPASDVAAPGRRGAGQPRGRPRGRGWQRGQEKDERFMNASRRIGVPQRRHGRPS